MDEKQKAAQGEMIFAPNNAEYLLRGRNCHRNPVHRS